MAAVHCEQLPLSTRRTSGRIRAAALVVGLGIVVAVGATAAFLRFGCAKSPRVDRPRGPLLGLPAPGIALREPPASLGTALSSKTAAVPVRRRPPLEDFVEFWVNGPEVNFYEVKGRPILLYFWHPRDGKSLDTLPRIVDLADRFAERGLLTVGFCVVDSPDEIAPVLSQYRVKFPIAVDCDGDLHRRYRVDTLGTPYCYLVDARQMVAWSGPPQDLMESDVRAVLP